MMKRVFNLILRVFLLAMCVFAWWVVCTAPYTTKQIGDMIVGLIILLIFTFVCIGEVIRAFIILINKEDFYENRS